ncbi:MAF protein [Allopseudospirillum japonicum]|uniref:7-methyl-GTP pyrophosphatase n=1 Tax=Allopseudospirillum japonicum TaxID=64971 RepID=A0A1H6QFQ5_9GAMM|nr:Maf family protein [Allopseudospirillum japonicum]SEI39087.1 MAF protein [Allopseudospirillum japonicum]
MSLPLLILASSSPYRQSLLQKLQLPFISQAPKIDESLPEGASAPALVQHLALQKALAVAEQHTGHPALVIGSDQLATYQDAQGKYHLLGKPHTEQAAIEQLSRLQGRSVVFYTGLCVYDQRDTQTYTCVEHFTVYFRTLSPTQIQTYVAKERPLDCAGSFKSEGLGICLFERLEGEDPNTLIGLPLIRLSKLLADLGLDPLAPTTH